LPRYERYATDSYAARGKYYGPYTCTELDKWYATDTYTELDEYYTTDTYTEIVE
jgi:hypothetical protein